MTPATDAPSDGLRPDLVVQLVTLRLMLQDALLRSRSATRFHTTSAVVGLDGVVERANWLVLHENQKTPKRNAEFEDLVSQVKGTVGAAWTEPLGRVKTLHRVRNGAQHEATPPDRESLSSWAEATESYVVSLIRAAFGVDVLRVRLADVIEDETLRTHLSHAEDAWQAQDVPRCVWSSREAMDKARRQWELLNSRRSLATRAAFPRRSKQQSAIEPLRKPFEQLAQEVAHLRTSVYLQTFASDPAEALWFRASLDEDAGDFDLDEAERMLSFVFGWIAGAEAARRVWVANRPLRRMEQLRQHRVAQRLVRSAPTEEARIEKVTARRTTTHGMAPVPQHGWEIAYVIRGVPSEPEYEAWRAVLHELLSATEGRWFVDQDGTARVRYDDAATDDVAQQATTDTDHLREVLPKVQAELDSKRRQQQQFAEERAESLGRRQQEADQIKDRLPTWVANVTAKVETRSDGNQTRDIPIWLVEVPSDISIRTWPYAKEPVSTFGGALDVGDVIRGQDGIVQCAQNFGTGTFHIEAGPSAGALLNALTAADQMIGELNLQHERVERSLEQEAATLVDRLRTHLVSIDRATPSLDRSQPTEGV